MIDLVTIQQDLTWVLLSSEQLTFAQVISYRAQRLSQEMDYRTMLTKPRNNKVGVAVVVLMPEAAAKHTNVDGPALDWDFPVLVVENDKINHTAVMGVDEQGKTISGAFVTAEELGQIVMDVLHKEADERFGIFAVTGRPMQVEKEFVFPGCISYRIVLTVSAGKVAQTRKLPPVIYSQDNAGNITLACSNASAVIRYTLDGSLPASVTAGQSQALTYTAPFFLASGGTMRACAYLTGFNKSPTRYFVAP